MTAAQQFRRKPEIVEAVPVDEALRCAARAWSQLPPWLAAEYERGAVVFARDAVHMYRGRIVAERGDWIVWQMTGHLSAFTPEAFEAEFEPSDQGRG